MCQEKMWRPAASRGHESQRKLPAPTIMRAIGDTRRLARVSCPERNQREKRSSGLSIDGGGRRCGGRRLYVRAGRESKA